MGIKHVLEYGERFTVSVEIFKDKIDIRYFGKKTLRAPRHRVWIIQTYWLNGNRTEMTSYTTFYPQYSCNISCEVSRVKINAERRINRIANNLNVRE